MIGQSDKTIEADQDWQHRVVVEMVPDPRLAPEQQAVVAHDFGMSDGEWRLSIRAKLLPFVFKLLQIDPQNLNEDPTGQQIVVRNLAEIQHCSFPEAGLRTPVFRRRFDDCLINDFGILGFLPVCK